jgi:hypothetical protein
VIQLWTLQAFEPTAGSGSVRLQRSTNLWQLDYALDLPGRTVQSVGRKWPPRASRVDDLWRASCCELFLAQSDAPQYLEFNFSPSGDWAAYAFESTRSGRRAHVWPGAVPEIQCRAQPRADQLWLQVRLPTPAVRGFATGLVGLSVITHTDEGVTHWALGHSGSQPDFHCRDNYVALVGALEI